MKRLRGILDGLGASVQVDGLEAWTHIGRRLAIVDRERFLKLLAAAETIVALYETADPDAVLQSRLPLFADTDDGFDA